MFESCLRNNYELPEAFNQTSGFSCRLFMRRLLLLLLLSVPAAIGSEAQTDHFKGRLVNDEYNVYLRIDFHGEGIDVPRHGIFGPLPGYLAKEGNAFYWLITGATLSRDGKKAEISLINDYGSEDLTATLSRENDTLFILKQGDGSPLKVPNNGKWQKLPSKLVLIKR